MNISDRLQQLEAETEEVRAQVNQIQKELRKAVDADNIELTKAALKKGAGVTVRDINVSIEKGNLEMLRLLVAYGGNLNEGENGAYREERLPLYTAVDQPVISEEIVLFLLQNTENYDARSSLTKMTPIQHLMYRRNTPGATQGEDQNDYLNLIQLFLSHGASLDAQIGYRNDDDGTSYASTAEMPSIFWPNDKELIALLVNYRTSSSSRIIIPHQRLTELEAKTKEVRAQVNQIQKELREAVDANNIELTKAALAKGAGVTVRDINVSIKKGNLEMLELLATHGGNLNEAQESSGERLPLYTAVDQPVISEEIVLFLLQNTENYDARSSLTKMTPIQRLMYRRNTPGATQCEDQNDYLNLIRLFLSHGASLDAQLGYRNGDDVTSYVSTAEMPSAFWPNDTELIALLQNPE